MVDRDTHIPSPSTRLMVPGFILFALVSVGTIRGPSLISSDGIGSAVIVVAPLILATYALTVIVMAGRAGVDLSIGPLIGFINVGLIKLLEAGIIESPVAVFLYAIAVGVAYQLLMGLIIVYVRVQPIIVSLSGYLALVGLNLIILPRPGGVAPDWMLTWGSGTSIFSPVLAIIVIATIGWYAIAQTAFFGHLRLMGSDERAAYTSGVKINIVRLGAHGIAGIYAGLAAICFTSLISSGDPTQGTTFTLMAVTALVLGGASLSGGRGGATGSLLGALNIYLITYLLATFNFGTVQSYVTDLSYGTMLVASLLISSALPQIQRAARYVSPALFFAILLSIGAGVILHATMDGHARNGFSTSSSATAAGAGTALQTGTMIMLVVIGMVAIAYIVSLLVRFPRAPMISLVVALIVIGLGLIFSPTGFVKTASGVAPAATTVSQYSLDAFSLEGTENHAAERVDQSPIADAASAIVLVLGVVTLVSLIITLNLFDPHAINPATLRLLLLAAVGLGALGVVTVLWTDNVGANRMFGREGLTVAATGALLFVLMWSPLQSKIKNIANVYIVVLSVVAFGSLYFSAGSHEHPTAPRADASDLRRLMTVPITGNPLPAMVPSSVSTTVSTGTGEATLPEISYSILVILALQFAVWLAMRGDHKIKTAIGFGYTIIGSVLAWAALFTLVGVSLTNIVVTVVVAAVTAPLVWRGIGSALRSLDRNDELADATGSGPVRGLKRGASL